MIIYMSLLFILSLILFHKFENLKEALSSISITKLRKLKDENLINLENFNILKYYLKSSDIYKYFNFGYFLFLILMSITFSNIFYIIFGVWESLISIIIILLIIKINNMISSYQGTKNYIEILIKNHQNLKLIFILFKPFILVNDLIGKKIIPKIFADVNFNANKLTEEDLIDVVSKGMEEGIIDKNESLIIENVMDFGDTYAKDIMTPRTDIIAINVKDSYEDIISIIKEEAFSRMPVYREDLDNILGILNVKDLLALPEGSSIEDNLSILKEPFYTYEFKPISALFNEMRAKKSSVCIVTDEYGGTEGMITTEDLIEKIVGSIFDEYDDEEDEDIRKISNNEYLINGSMSISDLNSLLNLNLISEETDSIAGYIIEKIDRFPKKGETLLINHLKFYIKEASKNRIEKIILKL